VTAAVGQARQRQVLAQLGLVRYRLRATSEPAARAATTVLQVSAPGSRAAPVDGVHGQVWNGVLAWLGLERDQVEWREQGGRALPAVADWASPAGKRDLWLALKGWRRPAG
jgi:hypothetical protein